MAQNYGTFRRESQNSLWSALVFALFMAVYCPASRAEVPSQTEKTVPHYVVEKGDSLTSVLFSLGLGPLWGKGGTFQQTLITNSFLKERENADLIYPGETIRIPDRFLARMEENIAAGFLRMDQSGRVGFICSEESLSAWVAYRQDQNPAKDPMDPKVPTLALRCSDVKSLPLRQIAAEVPEQQVLQTETVQLKEPPEVVNEPDESKVVEVEAVAPEIEPAQSVTIQKLSPPRPKIITSRVGFGASYGFSVHDSMDSTTGANAHILSTPTLGYLLTWSQLWSDTFETRISMDSQRVIFRDTKQGQVKETGVNLAGFGLDFDFKFSWADLRLILSQREEAFVRAPGVGSAIIDPFPRTRFGLVLNKEVLTHEGLSASVLGGRLIGMSASTNDYSVQSDTKDLFGIGVIQRLDGSRLIFNFVYTSANGQSSVSTTADKSVQGTVSWEFDLGRSGP